MLDLRQTKEYADFLRREGWVVEKIDGINYFIKKFPLIGSFLKLQRPEKLDLACIHVLLHKYRVFQVIVEPKDQKQAEILAQSGFKLAKSTYLPSKTLQIDLTKSQKEIYADFQRNIKTGIKRSQDLDRMIASRKGRVSKSLKEYSTLKEIKLFREGWKNSVKFTRYVPTLKSLLNLRKSFPDNKSRFLASHNISGKIIGGVIFTISSHEVSNYITYYDYGFMSKEGRSSLSMASLLYQGILWGKKLGCKIFDFDGLYDPRFPQKSWLGFTRFKKSFGGYEVLYPGCYMKFRIPL